MLSASKYGHLTNFKPVTKMLPACRVIAACRKPESAEDLNGLAKEHQGRLDIVQMDITDEDSIQVRPQLLLVCRDQPFHCFGPPRCTSACLTEAQCFCMPHCTCNDNPCCLQEAFKSVSQRHEQLDRLINATGILHSHDMSPGMLLNRFALL